MSAKRIFVLDGHPGETSLSRNLALAYADAAQAAGHSARLRHLHGMDFDADFGGGGYGCAKSLEPDLDFVMADIEWAEHVVIATPVWWGGLPARLKWLIDRAFLPDRSFDTRNTTVLGLPRPPLGGRTGRVVLTSDTPGVYFRLVYRNALMRQLRRQVPGFVGIAPTRITHSAGASDPRPGMAENWRATVRRLGRAAA